MRASPECTLSAVRQYRLFSKTSVVLRSASPTNAEVEVGFHHGVRQFGLLSLRRLHFHSLTARSSLHEHPYPTLSLRELEVFGVFGTPECLEVLVRLVS